METENAISWNNVYDSWKEYFYQLNNEEAKSAFNGFFDVQRFFSSKSPTFGMPLALGKYLYTLYNKSRFFSCLNSVFH